MPAFIPMIWGALASVLASLVGRVIVALGLSAVTYKGLDLLVSQFDSYINAQLAAVPADVSAILEYLGVYIAIKMHLSVFASIAAVIGTQRIIKAVAK